jgi:hypothetical protein
MLIPISKILLTSFCFWFCGYAQPKIDLLEKTDRVEVNINGKLFTSYLHSQDQPKPLLVPLRTPSGIEINRRYPLTKLEGGSDDHPHHIGLFFAVDQVNGTNFWKNVLTSPQIKHITTEVIKSGMGIATLQTLSSWNQEDGTSILRDRRIMIFEAGEYPDEYSLDISIELTAVSEQVIFKDIEEGMFAIRLADALRESGSKVIPPPGRPLPKESVEGTGLYFSSNGEKTANLIWGKRARWVALQGIKENKIVGVAILNHPESINYPTYWHVRGYGLFSANPLGQGDFLRQQKNRKNKVIPLNLTLDPGETAYFRFKVIIYDGRRTHEQIEERFNNHVN